MTRNELAMTFHGVGVELGVAAGDYSQVILDNPNVGILYSIDAWDHILYGHSIVEYALVIDKFKDYHASMVLRAKFNEAVMLFEDGTFDFIYIDGFAHTGQEGGCTLEDWWPKVKKGGLFCGHDYCQRWQPTVNAVNIFIQKHKLDIETTENDEYPSWIIRK